MNSLLSIAIIVALFAFPCKGGIVGGLIDLVACNLQFNPLSANAFPHGCAGSLTGCDVMCQCVHKANYGECTDWPQGFLPLAALNEKMCRCEYNLARPANYTPAANCALDEVSTNIRGLACSATQVSLESPACNLYCKCAHGAQNGGKCTETDGYCVCT